MIRWCGRFRVVVSGCLAAFALIGSGGVTPSAAAPDPTCVGFARVFAVDAWTGHLTQITSCPGEQPWFGAAAEVDSTDWRAYSTVFGVYDGDAVILYAVTATGELWWWRQDTPDAALSGPVRVAGTIDWRHDVVFAAQPGYLELGDYGAPIRTFRHDGWASGGTEVSEEGQLFTALHGPRITAVAPGSGYAVGIWGGVNYRVWRDPNQSETGHDDVWYRSGRLPIGVSGVTGDGTSLYGVDAFGGVEALWQREQPPDCPRAYNWPWIGVAWVPGHFSRVVVPIGGTPAGPPPTVAPPPPPPLFTSVCGPPNGNPWEWQI
jgi:hypothetical protein